MNDDTLMDLRTTLDSEYIFVIRTTTRRLLPAAYEQVYIFVVFVVAGTICTCTNGSQEREYVNKCIHLPTL